jgi:hypothetical protein
MSLPSQTLGSWIRIPLEALLFVHVSSLFVLSCVGTGLAIGPISRPRRVLPAVCKARNSILILMGNRPEGLTRKEEEEEEEEEEM